ncbi:MAG: LytTR family transcriptional regulator [Clostridia bacterium]|nr:LytTR family transcriptional regulator [Clostridia bacterium]
MKFSLILGEEYEGEVVIYAKEENATVSAIRAICEKEEKNIVGYSDGGIYTLSPYEIDCFVSEKDQLFAYTAVGKLRIKSRLSKIEEDLPSCFIRINQSCIANLNMIERFDASFSGTLGVIFKNGYRDYVSRRNLKKVKERIGI